MSLDHAWMKGVPMDLRPRYFPKPPIKFKDIDIYIPLDAIENDYDFTEERRVLIECKMWEEEKEKERLAEEERQRQLEEEAERLRLQEEERKEQERLQLEAAAAAAEEATTREDQDNSLSTELNSKLNLGDRIVPEEDSGVVPNHSSSSSSKPNSPVSEENSVSHPQPQLPQATIDNEPVLPPPPPSLNHPHFQSINGYHYNMMNNEVQQMSIFHPIPHQTYYNYYVPPQQVTAPIAMPQQQQHHQQQHHPHHQPPSTMMHSHQHQPGTSPGYPTNPQQNSGCVPVPPQPPAPPPVLQPTQITGSSASPQTTTMSSQPVTTPAGADSGSNSPAGSEKSSSGQNQQQQAHPQVLQTVSSSKKVDLKDLSDFENDTANPFDNVELKSINDMEVLASVLKNHVPIPNPNSQAVSSPSPNTVTPTPDACQTTSTGSNSYVNGGGSGGGYYHQPTPIYPPVTTQCPYPPPQQNTWNTNNGYYPTVSVSSAPVSTTSVPTSIAPPQPQPQQSHVPSPTQTIDQTQAQNTPQQGPDSNISGMNSFTKLHFPFLTSMAQSSARGNRDNYGSPLYNRFNLPQSSSNSNDDFTSQNPFLSSYVQSHSPLHQHQYWPGPMSQIAPQQQQQQNPFSAHHTNNTVQNGPVQVTQHPVPGTGYNIPSSGPSAAPTGSHHALR